MVLIVFQLILTPKFHLTVDNYHNPLQSSQEFHQTYTVLSNTKLKASDNN